MSTFRQEIDHIVDNINAAIRNLFERVIAIESELKVGRQRIDGQSKVLNNHDKNFKSVGNLFDVVGTKIDNLNTYFTGQYQRNTLHIKDAHTKIDELHRSQRKVATELEDHIIALQTDMVEMKESPAIANLDKHIVAIWKRLEVLEGARSADQEAKADSAPESPKWWVKEPVKGLAGTEDYPDGVLSTTYLKMYGLCQNGVLIGIRSKDGTKILPLITDSHYQYPHEIRDALDEQSYSPDFKMFREKQRGPIADVASYPLMDSKTGKYTKVSAYQPEDDTTGM